MINYQTDIIRENNIDYVNINSENRLIKKLVGNSAENIYGFGILFGRSVDKAKVEEMKNTYWLRVAALDNTKYDDSVNLAIIQQ